MYEDIRYETEDGIATVTIDRPDAYDAFTHRTIRELNAALAESEADDGVDALILTGAGDGFCAGADVTEMPDWGDMGRDEYARFLRDVQSVVRQLRTNAVPSVAAVGGPAIGAGCDFALACDARVIAPDAFLREGFVRVGLVPGDGGAWLLPRLIGESKAKEYLLTGDDITAEDAVDLGLAVERSATPLAAAREFAGRLLDRPRVAVRRTKELANHDGPFDEHCELAIEHQWACVRDPEHEEAVAAFREERDPQFDREYR
ncbi:enoyl-CoA hydratase/isomerase family protein [Halorarum salinum]|uniref:Enoyl-CoA hydratase/isomerase family protein n=1 Tax=Halorarum salinum TaxID=2743089 RepID=A0A7D5QAG9_9EURY|nr:enoyl-CoA hydratase/isomerase family protein [Halobaculum salinum]QLG61738.1 enoyl-CoA hydratase/isomerase family protein [Halobaculum salinum]